ncbi:MAG: acetyl-CoA carboxylase biotin carboxylase subunit, partial [Candidatus Omnitrophica bacterium]|nr:acetyl-CoA carboxylase biotin carboxylase subunit [Candidatus Omnitrophota bacterium]
GGKGVRLDSCAYQGYNISPYYDSLLAKLITYGSSRSEAIQIMRRALEEYTIEPIKTTIGFYQGLLNDARFLKGKLYTDFVDILITERQKRQKESEEIQ